MERYDELNSTKKKQQPKALLQFRYEILMPLPYFYIAHVEGIDSRKTFKKLIASNMSNKKMCLSREVAYVVSQAL